MRPPPRAGGGPHPETESADSEYLGTTGGWTYTARFGADKACPRPASRWTDAFPDWGGQPVDGNTLAPDAAHC